MAVVAGSAWRASVAVDRDYAGPGHIINTIAVSDPNGTPERPIARRVTLFDRRSLHIIQSTVADPLTGAYAFRCLRTDIPYLLIADDYSGRYNAVVADWVEAEV